jgi:hypothetical protein
MVLKVEACKNHITSRLGAAVGGERSGAHRPARGLGVVACGGAEAGEHGRDSWTGGACRGMGGEGSACTARLAGCAHGPETDWICGACEAGRLGLRQQRLSGRNDTLATEPRTCSFLHAWSDVIVAGPYLRDHTGPKAQGATEPRTRSFLHAWSATSRSHPLRALRSRVLPLSALPRTSSPPAPFPPGPRRLHTYTTPLHSWFTAAVPRSAYACVLPTVLPALAWPPTAPRRSGELTMQGTAMLYLLADCTGRHVLCALHTLVEQRRGPARLAQLSWPSRGAPEYPAPLHGVSGLWVNLFVLLHDLHARQPLHWAASTALVSSWRSRLFSHHVPPARRLRAHGFLPPLSLCRRLRGRRRLLRRGAQVVPLAAQRAVQERQIQGHFAFRGSGGAGLLAPW